MADSMGSNVINVVSLLDEPRNEHCNLYLIEIYVLSTLETDALPQNIRYDPFTAIHSRSPCTLHRDDHPFMIYSDDLVTDGQLISEVDDRG